MAIISPTLVFLVGFSLFMAVTAAIIPAAYVSDLIMVRILRTDSNNPTGEISFKFNLRDEEQRYITNCQTQSTVRPSQDVGNWVSMSQLFQENHFSPLRDETLAELLIEDLCYLRKKPPTDIRVWVSTIVECLATAIKTSVTA